MPDNPDPAALVGRSLGAALDEIAPWSSNLGFTQAGPNTTRAWIAGEYSEEQRQADEEVRQKLDPILTALESGAVVLIDVNGAVLPREVWLSDKGWTLYRSERGIERLEAVDENGRKSTFYQPRFQAPSVAAAPGAKPGIGSGKALILDTAQGILNSPEAPARGRGFKTAWAKAIQGRLGKQNINYELSSIVRYLPKLDDAEKPDKPDKSSA